MTNRLEVTLFGTQYCVGVLHMNRDMVKAGIKAYGSRKWGKLVNEISLSTQSQKLIGEVSHTIGHTIKIEYRATGIGMQGSGFGLSVFYKGDYFPVEMVEAKNKTITPSELMKCYNSQEMLGVFWARREGTMSFRWDDVESLKQQDLALVYDGLAPVLARKRSFDLALGVTCRGQKGHRVDFDRSGPYESLKHVFHVMN